MNKRCVCVCRMHIYIIIHVLLFLNVYTGMFTYTHMGVSENGGTPKSSILIGFSIINHPFWGIPIFGNIHIYISISLQVLDASD